MTSPVIDEVQAAATAVFCTYDGRHAEAIAGAVSDLLSNRRALAMVVTALQARAYWNRTPMRPIVERVLDALSRDPLTMTLRVRLAATCQAEPQIVAYVLQHLDELHPEALMEAVQHLSSRRGPSFLESFDEVTPSSRVIGSPGTIIEAELKGHPDPRLRRLALAALVAQSASGRGWTIALRQRLAEFQRDSSPLVASAATFTFPEEVPE